MAYPSKFAEVERRYGKPIRDVLLDLLNEHKSAEKVATIIGVSHRRTVDKIHECGILHDKRYYLLEPENA